MRTHWTEQFCSYCSMAGNLPSPLIHLANHFQSSLSSKNVLNDSVLKSREQVVTHGVPIG